MQVLPVFQGWNVPEDSPGLVGFSVDDPEQDSASGDPNAPAAPTNPPVEDVAADSPGPEPVAEVSPGSVEVAHDAPFEAEASFDPTYDPMGFVSAGGSPAVPVWHTADAAPPSGADAETDIPFNTADEETLAGSAPLHVDDHPDILAVDFDEIFSNLTTIEDVSGDTTYTAQSGLLTEYTSGNANGSGYNVTIVFEGADWTVELQQAFIEAADYLSTLIVGDLTDIRADFGDGQGIRTIDDLEISANLEAIDGVGGILGQAGPQYIRTEDSLPITGIMEFDSADADNLYANGTWSDVVLHEMVHVLGFGSLWEYMGIVTNVGTDTEPDWRFTGANAMYEYESLYPDLYAADPNAAYGVPVESDEGGAGTVGGHWDEATFGDELMTGFLSGPTTLSNMTIASLEDIGYQTTYTATAPACFTPGASVLTPTGAVPVENLRRGDKVCTLGSGTVKVNRVAIQRLTAKEMEDEPRNCPVRIRAGALGKGIPARDVVLSRQHRVYLSGPEVEWAFGQPEVLVPAKDLTALPGIDPLGPRPDGVIYLHLKLARHEVLIVDGAPLESFKGKRAPACPIVSGRAARAGAARIVTGDCRFYAAPALAALA